MVSILITLLLIKGNCSCISTSRTIHCKSTNTVQWTQPSTSAQKTWRQINNNRPCYSLRATLSSRARLPKTAHHCTNKANRLLLHTSRATNWWLLRKYHPQTYTSSIKTCRPRGTTAGMAMGRSVLLIIQREVPWWGTQAQHISYRPLNS